MADDSSDSLSTWESAFRAALDDAIEHLQLLIFEEGWNELLTATGSVEAAMRKSVSTYERELARLFTFLRASGALPDAVAWSALKTDLRRAALNADTELTLRTALESGLYAAESVPLGDHDCYNSWVALLTHFLRSRANDGPPPPELHAPEVERLEWAYATLADVEEHDAFHTAFTSWVHEAAHTSSDSDEIIAFQAHLLDLPRFDLILNTGLRWLAGVAPSS